MSGNTWMTTQTGQPPKAGETVTVHTPNGSTQGTFNGSGAGVYVPGQGTYWPTKGN